MTISSYQENFVHFCTLLYLFLISPEGKQKRMNPESDRFVIESVEETQDSQDRTESEENRQVTTETFQCDNFDNS